MREKHRCCCCCCFTAGKSSIILMGDAASHISIFKPATAASPKQQQQRQQLLDRRSKVFSVIPFRPCEVAGIGSHYSYSLFVCSCCCSWDDVSYFPAVLAPGVDKDRQSPRVLMRYRPKTNIVKRTTRIRTTLSRLQQQIFNLNEQSKSSASKNQGQGRLPPVTNHIIVRYFRCGIPRLAL